MPRLGPGGESTGGSKKGGKKRGKKSNVVVCTRAPEGISFPTWADEEVALGLMGSWYAQALPSPTARSVSRIPVFAELPRSQRGNAQSGARAPGTTGRHVRITRNSSRACMSEGSSLIPAPDLSRPCWAWRNVVFRVGVPRSLPLANSCPSSLFTPQCMASTPVGSLPPALTSRRCNWNVALIYRGKTTTRGL